MPRTLADIFTDHPRVDVLEVVSSDDGGPFGLSADGRRLKILDDNFARQLDYRTRTQKPATLNAGPESCVVVGGVKKR